MTEVDISLLAKVCELPGAPGFEQPIRKFICETVAPFVDELRVDNMGNVITLKKGNANPDGKKVMVAAHMDEIGFIVTHITEQGFLKFHTLGGFDPKTLTAQRVIVHGKQDLIGVMGSKPVHVMKPEERNKPAQIDEFFIDLGLPKEEVEKFVQVGTPVTRERGLIEMGDCVNCKSLDNRVSVYILIETLKQLKNVPYDVYGVFSVQEEVGLRGANVAAHQINPDYGIALDTTIAYDTPSASAHEKITSLGNGTAIKIMDSSVICDYRMVAFLKATAEDKGIKWQSEILTAGGTDTASVQRMGQNGSIAGAISIPTRHIHQVIEMVHKKDVAGSVGLLKAALENINAHNWEFS
ncbi:M42 family metallopeptidase [Cytophagaceae bacterium ABcell3]|nr:M42 family metallopeptidase [Cytophagaceae bacterium ABcell3]